MIRPAVLIPALDCEATVGTLVEGARRHAEEVFVVDDGSDDDTAERARLAGAIVLHHPVNLGKGAALREGLEHLAVQGFTHALTMDADGQHLPSEIPRLLAAAEANPDAFVVGARRVEPGDVAPLKRFGNEFANLWVWIASGVDCGDTQSGFRVYPIESTLALGLSGTRFELETEVLILAALAEYEIVNVSVETYYPPPDTRSSHYNTVWDTVRIIQTVLGIMTGLRR